MNQKNFGKSITPVGYSEEGSLIYDKKRFSDPHGILFNNLETKQLYKVVRQLDRHKKILEVGCGTGRFTKILLSTESKVYGLDLSIHMLKQAISKTGKSEFVEYIQAEASSIPLKDNIFDFVYSIRVINQLPSREYAFEVIKEMIRVCNQEGLILIEFVNSWGITRKKSVKISVRDINSLLKQYPYMKIVNISGILFFSQSVMNKVPVFLLNSFKIVDNFFANLLPQFSTRCYVALKKGNKL
ncbi:MAG: hypothetical protein QG588_1060 [Candidatus Poribacteria bacterium]|nr:hypothetical protein [Candidatus Poribacteria bacterium]